MWHEARKQERKIRGMMVDYKKRAERRREFYEKTKADPTQFIQIHGRRCKIHLDPAVAQAADSPLNMMPWQGHSDNLIDRFDGRAHLDIIPENKNKVENDSNLSAQQHWEERQTNYERYRILVENDFIGISEEKFLQQIYLEEQFGPVNKTNEDEKKKLSEKKAAIGYVYEDSTQPSFSAKEEEEKKDSDSEIDLDVTVDVGVLTTDQAKEMNEHSIKYGMVLEDFITLMTRDKEEAESLRLAKEAEEEKAMYSGRKSRRERRAFREKKLLGRKISPPSYAARESPSKQNRRSRSTSRSRSHSPVDAGKITFITSFGDDASDESGNEANKNRISSCNMLPSVGPTMPPSLAKVGPKALENAEKISTNNKSTVPLHTSSSKGSRSDLKTERVSSNPAPVSSVSRSRTSSSSRSNSSSPSSSRHRDKYLRKNRGLKHRSRHSTRSESRSPSRSYRRSHRKTTRSRSRSRSSSRTRSRNRSNSRSPYSSRSSSTSSSRSSKYGRSRSRSKSRARSKSRSKTKSDSRSRSRSSRSWSRSRSKNRSGSSSRSSNSSRSRRRSKSPKRYSSKTKSYSRSPNGRSSPKRFTNSSTTNFNSSSTTPAVRYYGRRNHKSESSSSSDSDGGRSSQSSRTPTSSKVKNVVGKAGFGTNKCTPQERLKRRMQLALNKQYKADKQAEMKKAERQEQERQDREEELRELAIKLRRRERERRHQRRSSDKRDRSRSSSSHSGSSSSSSSSNSSSRSRTRSISNRKSRTNRSSSESSDSNSRKESRNEINKRRSKSPLVRY